MSGNHLRHPPPISFFFFLYNSAPHLANVPDHGRRRQHLPLLPPAQRRRQVEPEAVHVVFLHPVPQGIEDDAPPGLRVGVKGVAAAGIVQELAVVALVVGRVVDAAEVEEVGVIVAAFIEM